MEKMNEPVCMTEKKSPHRFVVVSGERTITVRDESRCLTSREAEALALTRLSRK